MENNEKDVLLDVKNLKTYFELASGTARAVDGVSFQLRRGGTLGVVGESARAKASWRSVIRLLRELRAHRGGLHHLRGPRRFVLRQKELRDYRGRDIGMIFQDPMTSLDPVFKVGKQMTENLRIHRNMSKAEARRGGHQRAAQRRIPNPGRASSRIPSSFRAACASASSSRWRCAATPRSSSPTSPRRRST